jgi:hypothetical protein
VRAPTEFSPREWLRLQPLVYAFKQARNDLRQAAYLRRGTPALARFLADAAPLRGRDVTLIVAFEQPWVLGWLLRMARRNLGDSTPLVFDNSRSPAARAAIERACAECGAAYLALPPNPVRHPNRSHGNAMTWIWHNAVRALQPRTFGFVDHDLIPLAPVSPAGRLAGQDFYGALNDGRHGWSLWAGYCTYDFAAVERLRLNFLYDFSRELDTGGRNWACLYRHHDRRSLRFASCELAALVDPQSGERRPMQVIDGAWLHLGGVSYNAGFTSRAEYFARLEAATAGGMGLGDLIDVAAGTRPANPSQRA